MAKKYRFRKVYFVCKDKEVLPANVKTETAFKWIACFTLLNAKAQHKLVDSNC